MDNNLEYNGLPFKGHMYFFKEDSPREKPVKAYDSKADMFNMSIQEDKDKLSSIYTQARKGTIQLEDLEKEYDHTEHTWKVYVVWSEKYYTNPKTKRQLKI